MSAGGGLRARVAAVLAEHGVVADGPIRVLTQPRTFGYTFNPVSFWWCHRADGTLAAVVAEINNTFGERRCQVLGPDRLHDTGGPLWTATHPKELHVSPFLGLDQTYRYRLTPAPGAELAVHLTVVDDATGEVVLRTSVRGTRRPLTPRSALAAAPALTPVRIITAIHRHALALWRAGVPFHHKPPYRPDLGSVPVTPTKGAPMPTTTPADAADPSSSPTRPAAPPAVSGRLRTAAGRRVVTAALAALDEPIDLMGPDGHRRRFGPADGPAPTLAVLDDRFYARLLARPRLALGEAYTLGHWTSDDLPTVLERLHTLSERYRARPGLARLARLQERRPRTRVPRVLHRPSARADIAYHYDLGNDLYELFLDETMAYSSAWFDDDDQPLHDAQLVKFDRLCGRLDLGPDDHLLEIGCGWGGFALHAATTTGCRVTAVTLSAEQARYARRRVADAGLADRIDVVERDYRDLTGTYTKIASVEMIEAVGHDLTTFFARCDRLLAPDGTLVVQAITKPDQRARRTRNLDDGWIERYIFPGSLIPSITSLTAAATESSRFVLHDAEEFGRSYATTLQAWRARFDDRVDDVTALGYDAAFQRTWDFYLATAEAGFRTGYLRVFHLTFDRIGPRHRSVRRTAHPIFQEVGS